MISQREELERIHGGKIELRDERGIPGLDPVNGREYLYYEDDGKNKPKKQFNLLLGSAGTITATSGGVVSDPCRIRVPAGQLFRALTYHGDLAGWRAAVQAGADARGLLLARIVANQFVISDGRSFPLSDCEIELS